MSDSPSEPTEGAVPRINALGIVVADVGASVAFYTRLGLAFPADAAAEDHVEAELGGGLTLMLDSQSSIAEMFPDEPIGGAGRISLAAQLPTPADVDSTYAALAADGFGHREPWDAFWGQRYASVHDPDGNSVDLYAPLAPAAAQG